MLLLNLILFCLILLYLIINSNYNRENYESQSKSELKPKPKIAVYTYNFGNFRGELNRNLDNFKNYPELDYYLFTDRDNVKSKKWNVIKVPLQPRTKHMNANRVTSKYYKWKIIPKELQNYDYLVHIDAGRTRYLNNFSYDKLLEIINNNKKYSFIGRTHPFLNDVYEECDQVLKVKYDYESSVKKWEKKLKNEHFKQKFKHFETCFFIRNLNDDKLTHSLKKVYDNLMNNELCRDQLVFLYTLQKNNYDKIIAIKDFSVK